MCRHGSAESETMVVDLQALARRMLADYARTPGQFFGEPIDVGSFFGEEVQRDEQREIAVIDTHRLDAPVHSLLDPFPDPVAPRLDNHGAAYWRGFGHVGFADDGLVPIREGEAVAGRAADGEGALHGGCLMRRARRSKPVATSSSGARYQTSVSNHLGASDEPRGI